MDHMAADNLATKALEVVSFDEPANTLALQPVEKLATNMMS